MFLPKLKTLLIKSSKNLHSFSSVKTALPRLNELVVSNCNSMTSFNPGKMNESIISIRIDRCNAIRNLDLNNGPVNLNNLTVAFCQRLTHIDLASIKSLKRLLIQNCLRLRKIQNLYLQGGLEYLQLRECPIIDMAFLDRLQELTTIKTIELNCPTRIRNERFIENHPALEKLYIWNSKTIDKIGLSKALKKLKDFGLGGCPNIKSFEFLGFMPELESLSLWGNRQMNDFSFLVGLKNLKFLDLRRSLVKSVVQLPPLSSLRTLDLSGSPELSDLKSISLYYNLETLSLRSCHSLMDINSLMDLFGLKLLDIRDCPKIQMNSIIIQTLKERNCLILESIDRN